MNTKNTELHKVVILGTAGSGKTTFMAKLSGAEDIENIERTIGIDFHVVRALIGKNIALQVWDYAGQPHFRDSGIFEEMVQGSSAFLFCYDSSDHESIDKMDKWLDIARANTKFSETIRYLIGLKVDQIKSSQQVALSNLIQKYLGSNAIQKHFLLSSYEDIGIDILISNIMDDLSKIKSGN